MSKLIMNKGVSILIPIFNFNVTFLVKELFKQASALTINFEILLVDDKSEQAFIEKNDSLISFSDNIRIIHLKENIGRAKIRNLLFDNAKFEACIIMDCDVKIVSDSFLLDYFKNLDNNIVVGGHVYSEKPPKNPQKYFHWLYGSQVEAQDIKKRLKNPYESFMTNCFTTTKTIFNKIRFNPDIAYYGHEDTLFGIELKKSKFEIKHILNPILHLGLDDEKTFYKKQEEAIENLAKLYSNELYKNDLENIKLIKFFNSPLRHTLGFIKLYSKFNSKDKSVLINFSLWKLEKFNKYFKS
ncbi:MAG: GT2 family glycosyltransferase [Planctomycetota bacterium]|jgi:GT2 family glycosyltransferase